MKNPEVVRSHYQSHKFKPRVVFILFDRFSFKAEPTENGEIENYLLRCPTHIRQRWKELKAQHCERSHGCESTPLNILRKRNYPGLDEFKQLIAGHPHTASPILDIISAGASVRVLQRIAEHPHASPQLLSLLACNGSAEVRMAVCENVKTSLESLRLLATDRSDDVRYRLAETASTPIEVVKFLMDDDNPYVAARASKTLQRKQREREGWLLLC